MFGENIENIEPGEEYVENIAKRVKTRRQNKETNRDTQRTFAPQDSSINLDNFTYGENYDELDKEDREILRNMNNEGRGLKILTKQQMFSRLPMLLAQIQVYDNKLLDNSISAGKDFAKIAGKKVLTKNGEATGDIIGNKIADKITKSPRNKAQKEDDKIKEETQELIILPEKREQIIRDLKLF